jgi:hypothetical protein
MISVDAAGLTEVSSKLDGLAYIISPMLPESQKRHPDAGGFRIWSLLARPEISVRTVERIMALNRQVYDDIPHVRHKGPKPTPQPHPYKAEAPHQYWFIDGRKMDFTLEDGVKWWSLIILAQTQQVCYQGQ